MPGDTEVGRHFKSKGDYPKRHTAQTYYFYEEDLLKIADLCSFYQCKQSDLFRTMIRTFDLKRRGG